MAAEDSTDGNDKPVANSEPLPKNKRTAERQLTKDDKCDDGDDSNDESAPGTFSKASDEVLKKRKIIKVPRTESGKVDLSKKKSVFAGVNLVASSSNSTTATTASTKVNPPKKVFGSSAAFSGFGSASSTSKTGFGSSATSGGFGASFSSTGGFGTSTGSFSGFGVQSKTAPSTSFAFVGSTKTNEETASGSACSPIATATKKETPKLPDQYELKSGEEDEITLFSRRCKTHRIGTYKDDDVNNDISAGPSTAVASSIPPSQAASFENKTEEGQKRSQSNTGGAVIKWIEVGLGPLKVLKNLQTKRVRLVQRRETSPNGPATKVILNALVVTDRRSMTKASEKHVRVVTSIDTFLFKFKSAKEANDLIKCLEGEMQSLDDRGASNKPEGCNASASENGNADEALKTKETEEEKDATAKTKAKQSEGPTEKG